MLVWVLAGLLHGLEGWQPELCIFVENKRETMALFLLPRDWLYCDLTWQVDFDQLFTPAFTRMSTTLYAAVVPSSPNHSLDTTYMIHNIRGQWVGHFAFSYPHNYTQRICVLKPVICLLLFLLHFCLLLSLFPPPPPPIRASSFVHSPKKHSSRCYLVHFLKCMCIGLFCSLNECFVRDQLCIDGQLFLCQVWGELRNYQAVGESTESLQLCLQLSAGDRSVSQHRNVSTATPLDRPSDLAARIDFERRSKRCLWKIQWEAAGECAQLVEKLVFELSKCGNPARVFLWPVG